MLLRVKRGNTSALAANLFCEETMSKRLWVSFLLVSAGIPGLSAQEVTLTPPESIVAENVPKVPTSLVERQAGMALTAAWDWPIGTDYARNADGHAIWRYVATPSG
jgi:hypothetical protein